MSSVDGVPAMLVMDPRIDLQQEQIYFVEKGPEDVRFRQERTFNKDISKVEFNAQVPNPKIGTYRRMYIDLDVDFALIGAVNAPENKGGPGNLEVIFPILQQPPTLPPPNNTLKNYGGEDLMISDKEGLRFLAFQQICSNVTINLNQISFSQSSSNIIEALCRCGFSESFNTILSTFPSFPDQFQEFADGNVFSLTNVNVKNPLNTYAFSTYNSRGSFKYIIKDPQTPQVDDEDHPEDATKAKSIVNVKWSEPIFISPLAFGDGPESKCFFGLNSVKISFNTFKPSLMWCSDIYSDDSFKYTTVEPSFADFPKLRLLYLTYSPLDILQPKNIYPLFNIQHYEKNIGLFPAKAPVSPFVNDDDDIVNAVPTLGNQTINFESDVIQLSSIPNRVILFARQNNNKTFADTDCYLNISNVSIQFNNRSNLLSSASEYDLYQMSVSNGVQLSWNQWHSYVGSVCNINFSRDISLGAMEAPGVLGSYQMIVSCTFKYIGRTLYAPNPEESGDPPVDENYIVPPEDADNAGQFYARYAQGPITDPRKDWTFYVVVISEGELIIDPQNTYSRIGLVSDDNILDAERWHELPRMPYYKAYNFTGSGSFFGRVKELGHNILEKVKEYGPKVLDAVTTYGPIVGALLAAGDKPTGIKRVVRKR